MTLTDFCYPLTLVLALALTGSSGCGGSGADSNDDKQASADPLPVEVMAVQYEDGYEIPVQFTGILEAPQDSWLGFEVGGTLKSILVEEGEVVQSGMPLALLDDSRVLAALKEAEAGLKQATSNHELALWSRDKTQEAYQLNAVSDQDWENARRQAEMAEAGLEAASSRVQALQVDLEKHTIRAPFPGTVLDLPLDEGSVIGAGAKVVRLTKSGPLLARIAVGVEAGVALEMGRMVTLRHNRSGETLEASVSKMTPEVQRQTRSNWFWFELQDGLDSIHVMPGDLVEYLPKLKRSGSGCWVPMTALTESYRGLWSCYALIPEAESSDVWRVERREVEALALDGERVFVRGDLVAGDRVIAKGTHRVAGGQLVRIVKGGRFQVE